METLGLNLRVGWYCILAGIVLGLIMGLFFHREDWLGGYSSFRRRMLRLGHIAFFGLGCLNILAALTQHSISLQPPPRLLSDLLIIGGVSMPLICILTAWRPVMRFLFPLPVVTTLVGVVLFVFSSSLQ